MTMEMDQLYSDIILEHNQTQENKHELADATLSEHGHNPSCGDAISQASADMMIDVIKGKTVAEALRLTELFLNMIKREVTDDDELEELEDAIALKNISNMPARVKCAVLAWHTLKEALAKEEKQ